MKTFLKVWLSIGLIAIGFGIIILIIAAGTGGLRQHGNTYDINESYDNVESIDMEIGYGKVTIKEGDQFSINATNLVDNQMESYVDNGTWTIRENEGNQIDLFGTDINLGNVFYWDDDIVPNIIITIPRDFTAEDFEFHIGAGYATADSIQAKTGSFTVGAGEFDINQLMISEESVYTVGTGQMTLSGMDAKNISVDCGVGDVMIEGTIVGDNKIKCGIGKVELNLTGDEDSYSYQVSSGIGNVSINDKTYHEISNEIISNNNAENNLSLDCGIGNISVEFQ